MSGFSVTLDSTVVLQVIQHCQEANDSAHGQLVGYECETGLVVVNSFAIPSDLTQAEEFATQRLKYFQDIKFENSVIGWYLKASEETNLNTMTLEYQYNSQLDFYRSIMLVYNPGKAASGEFPIAAYAISKEFMNFMAEEELPAGTVFDITLKSEMVFVRIPVKVEMSPLVKGFLAQFSQKIDAAKLLAS
jgi:hypothetical protein